MRAVFLTFLALVAYAMAGAVSLTDANFKASVTNGDVWFVKFFAPWCGHCKRLAPVWEKLADEVAASGKNVHIASVDCTIEKDVCSSQGIRGYPTLEVFTADQTEGIKYQGPRELDALKKFALKHAN